MAQSLDHGFAVGCFVARGVAGNHGAALASPGDRAEKKHRRLTFLCGAAPADLHRPLGRKGLCHLRPARRSLRPHSPGCLAPALLSVPIGYRQVVPLFRPDGPGALVLQAMQAVLDSAAGRSATFLEADLRAGEGAWALVDQALIASGEAGGHGVPGFKAVSVTKILHRKRPHLVPIFDTTVYRFYTGQAPPYGPYRDTPRRLWPLLQADLRANQEWLEEHASPLRTPDGRSKCQDLWITYEAPLTRSG
ncbi:DUF6308 family protein [Streptomyces sp. 8N616]|uniref:DUF6308 family protein n=1 Tax=Streptomyces sp. 8N616 TaxID=3457414 RepID=UPI003FD3990B